MIKIYLFSLILLSSHFSYAQVDKVEVEEVENVEVLSAQDIELPYKERRSRWGLEVGFQHEQVLPFNYVSGVPDVSVVNYSDFAGSNSIPLNKFFLGGKFNTSLGSLAAGIEYGSGSLYLPADNGENTSMDLTKEGLYMSLYLDSIFSEPYVVPYGTFNVFRLTYSEAVDGKGTYDGTTDFMMGYTLGALFQLNWLDKESARTGLRDSGIQNTYVDVYVSSYMPSIDDLDPNFETEFDLGVGLRVEF